MELQCIARGIARLVNGFHCNSKSPEGAHYIPSCFESPGGGNLRHKPMAATYFTNPKRGDRLAQLWEDLLADPVPLQPAAKQRKMDETPVLRRLDEPVPFLRTDDPRPMSRGWRVDFAKLFLSLLEPVASSSPRPSAADAISEGEASSDLSIEAAHEASLSYSTPFHWEPKPAWIKPDRCEAFCTQA
jgi:hypothetical protein